MERGSLDLLLGDWFPEPSPLYVVYPQFRHLSGRIRVFVDWVAQMLGDHDGIQLRSTLGRKVRCTRASSPGLIASGATVVSSAMNSP